jgi:EAL domain-containing protein (putative c-di-GMP-specific phosphodiesterase class I)
MADRLRGAVQRGELRVHYQPRVDARSSAVVGVEALLRWTDALLGPVSPAEFVPIAERSGLMSEIGAWVMREACLAHQRWAEQGFGELRLSVNVSAEQVQSASLRDAVVDAVMGAGMAPTLLEIELTESALVDNQNTAAQLLRELAEIGVSLSLDDFGTGHSALSYLRTFPVRVLKIDPSFVREINAEHEAPPFVNAILALARTLDLGVVAEGVETALQRDALLERGCHEMQGYLFSPPVPEQQLLALLRAGPLTGGV